MKYLTVQQIRCADPDVLPDRLDPLMEELLGLEACDKAIEDPDLAADVSTGQVDVQMIIEADDPPAAMAKAFATVRTAIHAMGDATPGWETVNVVMLVAPVDAAERLDAYV
jgi:hypothetical protein